jgi:hypothetical protein
VTVDEELNLLDESVRRLKIEYDVFFGGGSKKPPADTEWRVQNLMKKMGDAGPRKLTFAQRFRYNSIAQKYAIFSDLWRQKMKVKEEGYRRPQDALLGIQGMRNEEERAAAAALTESEGPQEPERFSAAISNADTEKERVQQLYTAMMEAKKRAGENVPAGNVDSFTAFVKKKTEQIRKDYGCHQVEYTVEIENGQVKLKAKAKV